MDTDRNLLFGVLALQADLIDAPRFAEACAAWTSRKGTPLGDLLVDRGWITPEDKAVIDHLMGLKLKKHRDDPAESLAAVADAGVRRALAALGVDDEDLRRSIQAMTEAEGHVLLSVLEHRPEPGERYTLTRLHAKGGIGQVWLARDVEFGREIALKELRPERADRPEVWARFLEEARITGQLEHPGIVPVYELATRTEDRQPFYTMRFVRGRTLTEAVRSYHARRLAGEAGPLDLRALLDAFVGACNAVAYAHSRGVIHRDLKGQNVVLGDYGEVIVLDWGLAKLVGEAEVGEAPGGPPPPPIEIDDGREETRTGDVIGTAAFMSPEQAEGRIEAIGPRSDVYGLGATLYEILTGALPFTGADTREVLRKVREEQPRPPRLACPTIPRALEAVCLKAMAKEPDGRYPSVRALADEIRRFLADEPVSAWREPAAVRLGRWARRHRSGVVAAAAILVVSAVALGINTVLIHREQARTRAEWLRAERNFRLAFSAVDRYYTRVSESELLDVPGLQPLRRDLLRTALDFYREFARERRDDPRLRSELGRAFQRLAAITAPNESPARSVALARESAAIFERLCRDEPGERRHRRDLAVSNANLAYWLAATGRRAEAEGAYRRADEALEWLSRDRPDDPQPRRDRAKLLNNRGMMVFAAGAFAEAAELYRQALALREELARDDPLDAQSRSDLAESLGNLGNLHAATNRADQAEDAYAKVAALFEELAAEHPDVVRYRIDLANARVGLGILCRQLGRPIEAEAALLEALEVRRRLAEQNPTVADDQHELARCLGTLAEVEEAIGRLDRAERSFEEARSIWEALTDRQPEVATYRRDLAATDVALGMLHVAAGRPGRAEPAYRSALALMERLLREQPGNEALRGDLAKLLANLGEANARLGRPDEASASFREAMTLWESLIDGRPDLPLYQSGLAWTAGALGKILAASGHGADAAAAFDRALTLQERLAGDHPEQFEFALYLGETCGNKGDLLREEDRPVEALAWYDRAIATFEALLLLVPGNSSTRLGLITAHGARAAALERLGRHSEAVGGWDRAVLLAGPADDEGPRAGRSLTLARLGDHARASADVEALADRGSVSGATLYTLARALALASATVRDDPALTNEDRSATAGLLGDRAIRFLRRAGSLGAFGDPPMVEGLRLDPDLAPVRPLPAFRLLMMDLAMPADPFTAPR